MTRRAAKVDASHAEVRDGLRALGWSVLDTSAVGGGFPDLVVGVGGQLPPFAPPQLGRGVVCGGDNYFVEVKSKGGKLTEDQQELAWTWRGNYIVAETAEEAAAAIQSLRQGRGGRR